ncbi:hypothetical protein CI109_106572 [Kwoniella shandongensis]|uniref:Uncharacterized protein n=1 Tax=Kwoniella shandongensis TaxID=1734106 RepID=A0A5M6C6B0_9TREE|nr:uncharacterized protein CI109_002753 [Kwoniella shandongensis]KAA5528995.1 hypothetical protein CI109_002753 [Kwoniella shandongensis]
MSTPLPFHLSTFLRPLSPPLAQQRLKSNLFILFLRSILPFFSPYRALRAGLTSVLNAVQGLWTGRSLSRGEMSWGEGSVWLLESLITLLLCWNILEAIVAIQYPSTYTPPVVQGMKLTPSKVSSPLTRSYSPSPSTPTASSKQLTNSTSSPLARSIYRPSPSSSSLQQQPQQQPTTPSRHPLANSTTSPSTAKILNLPIGSSSPSKTGLFFDQQQGETTTSGSRTGTDGDFVLVDREEKEYVDNLWKGVRGKGGR